MRIFEKTKVKTKKRLTYMRDISQSEVIRIIPKTKVAYKSIIKETSLTRYFDNLKGLNSIGRIVFNSSHNQK